ncbi:MAG: sensor histidine kinase [Bacteroidales bacterium]
MRGFYSKILGIVFSLGLVININGQSNKAEHGILDLSKEKFSQNFLIRLNGEWEFYWKQKLYPNDFTGNEITRPDIFANVPSYWTDYTIGGKKLDGTGYATYRLRIILPHGYRERLGIRVPVFDSSYDMWLDGVLVGSNGVPGKSVEETVPGYKPFFHPFSPKSDTVTFLINVSNFHHRKGGFWLPMRFGVFNAVQKTEAATWAGRYVTVSVLTGFAIFFFIFFLLYPKDRIMAYFSLAIFGLALRPVFTSQFLIYDFINLGWTWTIRMEYISLIMIILGWTWFLYHLYPAKYFRIYSLIITAIYIPATIAVLFLPVKIFSFLVLLFYPTMIIIFFCSLLRSLMHALKGNKVDYIYFSLFLVMSIGAVHDIFVSLGKTDKAGYVMSYMVIIFVFTQAILLLYKWVSSFYEKEKLQVQLEFMNRNLEDLVKRRTSELITRNEEIEKQSARIAQQNKLLSDTIQLKNRIFSVIAHDLRSPVVNILYMLNLLKEEEYREKLDSFANASIQYAQMVINLLENMLVWGRGQEDKIRFGPGSHDVSSLILTNMSILKESADRKDIVVNFTQKGNSTGYFDKDLMDIVIRNLLSNAIKYTHRGGRISILVKDNTTDGEGLLIKICDNGIGISESKLRNLFSTDEMVSTPGTENEKGTGLGLKLCNELVKINNGDISVESREGEGTCFAIRLPASKVPGIEEFE